MSGMRIEQIGQAADLPAHGSAREALGGHATVGSWWGDDSSHLPDYTGCSPMMKGAASASRKNWIVALTGDRIFLFTAGKWSRLTPRSLFYDMIRRPFAPNGALGCGARSISRPTCITFIADSSVGSRRLTRSSKQGPGPPRLFPCAVSDPCTTRARPVYRVFGPVGPCLVSTMESPRASR